MRMLIDTRQTIPVRAFVTRYLFLPSLLLIGGCHAESEEAVATPTYNAIGLCDDGEYETDQSPYLTQTMFQILGLLDEYFNGFDETTDEPHSGELAAFYPDETALADRFEELIIQFGEDTGFSFEYERDENEFTSTELGALIDGYYINPDGCCATLDRNVFCNTSEDDKLSFLEGVFMRYGNSAKENWISMANAADKMVTTGFVLRALECNHISIYVNEEDSPMAFYLVFDPSPRVADRLGIDNVLSVKALKKKYPGLIGEATARFETIE